VRPDVGTVRNAAELIAIAQAMEQMAVERYQDLAVAFDESRNRDTGDAFRELAETELRHVAELSVPAGGPDVTPWVEDDPEIADPGAVHYLMLPWHAFDLALRHEEKAVAFFETLAAGSPHAEVRAAAAEQAQRKRGHVAAVKQRLAELPVPPDDWDEDDDPPNWDM
jgi:rubrerythrin